MIYMEPGLSPGYRHEEEEEGEEGLEEEEEEASPGFVDSWLRRCLSTSINIFVSPKWELIFTTDTSLQVNLPY
jgi:hypothetical protein